MMPTVNQSTAPKLKEDSDDESFLCQSVIVNDEAGDNLLEDLNFERTGSQDVMKLLDQVEDYKSSTVSASDGWMPNIEGPLIIRRRTSETTEQQRLTTSTFSIMDKMQEAIDEELFGRKRDSKQETNSN